MTNDSKGTMNTTVQVQVI